MLKLSCDKFPLKIVAKCSQVSHTNYEYLMNRSQFSFRESKRASKLRQLCEGLATYETKLRLIGDKNERFREFRENIVRMSCEYRENVV